MREKGEKERNEEGRRESHKWNSERKLKVINGYFIFSGIEFMGFVACLKYLVSMCISS